MRGLDSFVDIDRKEWGHTLIVQFNKRHNGIVNIVKIGGWAICWEAQHEGGRWVYMSLTMAMRACKL
jgi:hypothetical protein